MAGGTITRIALGTSITDIEEDFDGYYGNLSMNAGDNNIFNAKVTNHAAPKDSPPVGNYFVKGWWTDNKDNPIKEATIGDTIRFHIQTQKILDGEEALFTVYDWDGLKIMNDKLTLTDNNTGKESNKIKISGNKGYIEWTAGEGSLALINEVLEGDDIELFVECNYKNEIVNLPEAEYDYLILYEKEVLITVIVELPHSKETGWGAKGLAGHSAMAIGDRYFDYGPNNTPGTYSEREYDVDFNKDGDKDDDVYLDAPSFKNSPGMPWWGTHIAQRKSIRPEDVTLEMVFEHIQLHWDDIIDPVTNVRTHRGTNIYGKVHKIEFYVKESESKKMIEWWEKRYSHLKVYSVFPWTGEQCTTTVKTAIQEAFSWHHPNYISDETQKPIGLLNELKKFVSTSKQHKDEKVNIEVIKEEAIDFH